MSNVASKSEQYIAYEIGTELKNEEIVFKTVVKN